MFIEFNLRKVIIHLMMPPCFTSEETELQKGQARRFIVLSMEFPASLVCDSVMVLAFRRSL